MRFKFIWDRTIFDTKLKNETAETAKNGFGVAKKNGRYRCRPLSSAKNNMSRLLRFHEFVSNSCEKRRRTLPIVLAKQACAMEPGVLRAHLCSEQVRVGRGGKAVAGRPR